MENDNSRVSFKRTLLGDLGYGLQINLFVAAGGRLRLNRAEGEATGVVRVVADFLASRYCGERYNRERRFFCIHGCRHTTVGHGIEVEADIRSAGRPFAFAGRQMSEFSQRLLRVYKMMYVILAFVIAGLIIVLVSDGGNFWLYLALGAFVVLVVPTGTVYLWLNIFGGSSKDDLASYPGQLAKVEQLQIGGSDATAGRVLFGLSEDGRQVAVSDVQPRRPHTLLIASTGSGKTTSVIRPNILAHNGAVIALDVKAEICRSDAGALVAAGRRVLVFDPEGMLGDQLPAGAEPATLDLVSGWQVAGGNWRSKLAKSMASLIFIEKSGDPAFSRTALQLGRALIAAALLPGRDEGMFASLAKTARMNAREMQAMLETKASCEDEDLLNLTREGSMIFKDSSALLDAGLSGVRRQLDFLQTAATVRSLNGNFPINQLLEADDKTVLLVVVPPSWLEHHAAALRIIFGSIGSIAEVRRRAKPANLLAVIDEAASLDRVDWLLGGAAVHRGYGISYLIAFQTAAQIERIYGRTGLSEFMGNCATLFLDVRDFETAERLSKALGEAVDHTYEAGHKGALLERQRTRLRLSADAIMQMDADHLIALLPAAGATRLRRASPQLFNRQDGGN